jgi:hypothetical protein
MRMLRIGLIERIVSDSLTVPNWRAGMFWELPLGMHQARHGALPRNNNNKNPHDPFNPSNPYEPCPLDAGSRRCLSVVEIIWDIGS